jgi:hypothetical protein
MSSPEPLVTAVPSAVFRGVALEPGATILYRFEDFRSAMDNPEQSVQLITLRQYRLQSLSRSRKTATLVAHHNATLKKPKRISLTAEHPWALPAADLALADFVRRKQWQNAFLQDQLRRVQAALAVAQVTHVDAAGWVHRGPATRENLARFHALDRQFAAIGASAHFTTPSHLAP